MIEFVLAALFAGSSFPPDVNRVPCDDRPPTAASSSESYFPEGIFDFPFVCNWYSTHLSALDELPLVGNSSTRQIRFTWLRSFHAPMTFRVVFDDSDDSALLIWKQTNGRGGYQPGEIDGMREFNLTAEQVAEVSALVATVDICSIPDDEIVGEDGAEWIFESAGPDHYCFHDQWGTAGHNTYCARHAIDSA